MLNRVRGISLYVRMALVSAMITGGSVLVLGASSSTALFVAVVGGCVGALGTIVATHT